MTSRSAPVIGFVGGIGAGKSSLARWIVEHSNLRAIVLDADLIGHEALKDPDIKQKLIDSFGESILNKADEIDRPSLARLVFGTEGNQQLRRQQLEAIVHPYIREQIEQEILHAQTFDEIDLIILDAAVMLESSWSTVCDLVVFLDVPHQERLNRVKTARGWTEEDLRNRESSQWSLQKKRSAADATINMNQPVDAAGQELRTILKHHFPDLL